MKIISLSASHRDLRLGLVEQLSAAIPQIKASAAACDVVREAIVLATCNRVEVYIVAEPHHIQAAVDAIIEAVSRGSRLPNELVREALICREDSVAVSHLFAVSSGLESMIVGEREIVGQVSQALDEARAAGTTGPFVERLFQDAIRTSREVEAATALASHGRSIVSVGLDLVGSAVGPWVDLRVLLIGTGKFAGACLRALRARECHHIEVYSPSGRAEDFAVTRGVTAVSDIHRALRRADVVIASSGRGSVLDAKTLGPIFAGPLHPRALLDLALSRDIDPDVRCLTGVTFVDLARIKQTAPQVTAEPVHRARGIVGLGVDRWHKWLRTRAIQDDLRAAVAAADHEIELLCAGQESLQISRRLRVAIRRDLHVQLQAMK